MNIYQGSGSCYARREGCFVLRIQKPGIDTVAEAVAIARLILRDYRRGWTYDSECRKTPMDHVLFVRRLNYLVTLAHKHGATPSEIRTIEKIVDYVSKYKRLPRQYMRKANKLIVHVRRRKKKRKR